MVVENYMEIPQKKKKLKIELPYDPEIPLLCTSEKLQSIKKKKKNPKNINSKRQMNPSVHSNIIYNRQDKEATCLPTGIGTMKMLCIHTVEYY